METSKSLDAIDQSILRILSVYEHLTPLQLWYEFGEDDTGKERVTEGEILSRLESLAARGFVERLTSEGVDGNSAATIYRIKTGK